MLVNFCDASLRTDVSCSTVNTEGYEVTNLVNNSDKGFLAYSCIRPPVSIEFGFICNIQISHIIVWPQVGAQKSSGFHLAVRSCSSKDEPFTDVSSAFLNKDQSGILFYRRDIAQNVENDVPITFAKRYIKPLNVTNYVSTLRVTIVKTDSFVPCIKKIEVWGKVSPRCGKDLSTNVMALWISRFNTVSHSENHTENHTNMLGNTEKKKERKKIDNKNLLDVPEEFQDPITFEIMTQPIILPSGKIIDQKTLEKHGYNEAIWGRPVSDPFTGIPLSDVHKPVAAFPLKTRIDKYLLEHCNEDEIKQMPRVLGSRVQMQKFQTVQVITCENPISSTSTVQSNSRVSKRALLQDEESSVKNTKRSFHGHLLPVVPLRNPKINSRTCTKKVSNSATFVRETMSKEEIDKRNAAIEERLNANIQVSSIPTCKCCINNIFYKLPCQHVICRKALLHLEKNVCTICKLEFKKSDPQRFHLRN